MRPPKHGGKMKINIPRKSPSEYQPVKEQQIVLMKYNKKNKFCNGCYSLGGTPIMDSMKDSKIVSYLNLVNKNYQ